LARLDERERLEQLVERSQSTREDAEGLRVFHEHRLAHEEVAELHPQVDVVVEVLLEGQLDVAADRQAASLLRPPVGRLPDPGPATGDDGEALLDQALGNTTGKPIIRVAAPGARRPEDAHRRTD